MFDSPAITFKQLVRECFPKGMLEVRVSLNGPPRSPFKHSVLNYITVMKLTETQSQHVPLHVLLGKFAAPAR